MVPLSSKPLDGTIKRISPFQSHSAKQSQVSFEMNHLRLPESSIHSKGQLVIYEDDLHRARGAQSKEIYNGRQSLGSYK